MRRASKRKDFKKLLGNYTGLCSLIDNHFDRLEQLIDKNERMIDSYGLAENHLLTKCIKELKEIVEYKQKEPKNDR